MLTIGKTFTFEAAHFIKDHPTCGQLHGHSWVLTVFVKGHADPDTGFLIDFKVLGGVVKDVLKQLDHKTINEVLNFSPLVITAETLVQYLCDCINYRLVQLDLLPVDYKAIGCRLQEGIDGGWAEYWKEV